MNRLAEIEARLAEINAELDNPDADLDALQQEIDELTEERRTLSDGVQRRAAMRAAVAGGAGTNGRTITPPEPQQRSYNAASPEYRTAFLKNLLGRNLNEEERAAFVHTTENTGAVVPTTMITSIWNLIGERHPILGDITIYRTGTIIEVVKHTGIIQGDAKTVAENTANDDEQNAFVKVTLSGKDFSKHVDISYALERMSVDAFEQYLTNEIAERIGAAMAADVVTQIGTDMNAANKIASKNADTLTFEEVAKLFGMLKRASGVVVYAKRGAIYNYLVGMVDTAGRPIFQTNAQEGALGVVLGGVIKEEDAVADNVLLIGDPKRVVYNMVQDIMIESDRDIKKHVVTYSGYARGQGTLIDPESFAELTITTSA